MRLILFISFLLICFHSQAEKHTFSFSKERLNNYKKITLDQLRQEPRYILPLYKYRYCNFTDQKFFSEDDEIDIDYLITNGSLSIWSD